jgi:RNA polymerase sigma factor (sigma-70 family)
VKQDEWLAQRFEEHRQHLKRVAERMLGSAGEADDAIQETWLKLSRSDSDNVENLGGWLTTVLARVCLDMLRARRRSQGGPQDRSAEAHADESPETDAVLADATGMALLVVLDRLTPAERVAFVLHDLFDLSFEVIAPILDRTDAATRKLATRARQRIRNVQTPAADFSRQRELVDAFLAASREGNFERLLTLLSSEVVLHADTLAVRIAEARQQQGAPALAREIHGAAQVANTFKGRAAAAQPAVIDGTAGAVWMSGGQVRSAFVFFIEDGLIAGIDLIMEPDRLAELEIVVAAKEAHLF